MEAANLEHGLLPQTQEGAIIFREIAVAIVDMLL